VSEAEEVVIEHVRYTTTSSEWLDLHLAYKSVDCSRLEGSRFIGHMRNLGYVAALASSFNLYLILYCSIN
jgi:hypothetical protein